MSTNHCAGTYWWWVCTYAPHLWFVHLPNWHFSLHLPPLQCPSICAVWNFQRLRFGRLPTSSQEIVKQKPTVTFTFTLSTIYEVNGSAQYLEICWPWTDNDAILTLYLIHTLSLTLSAFCRDSNSPISSTPTAKLYRGADVLPLAPLIIRLSRLVFIFLLWPLTSCCDTCPLLKISHNPSHHLSTHPSNNLSINLSIDPLIHPTIHWSIDQSIDRSINLSIHLSINWSIDQLINWTNNW